MGGGVDIPFDQRSLIHLSMKKRIKKSSTINSLGFQHIESSLALTMYAMYSIYAERDTAAAEEK